MSNNDNVMARFLFAILQQKCLKDIDWNKVAHNPILAQEITNGHAARMRYSRFRAAMLGLEPQRRNRTNPNNKNRVSKKKKDDSPKPKKERDENRSGSGIGNIKIEGKTDAATNTTIKSERRSIAQPSQPPLPMTTAAMTMKTEPGLFDPFSQQQQQQHLHHSSILSAASPRIKQERLPTTTTAATAVVNTTPMPESSPFGLITTTPTTSTSTSSTPYIDSGHHRMQMRLLTPCSDSDGGMQAFLPHSPGGPSSAAAATSDLLQHSQHHPSHHQHQHQHHIVVGAGSPPLSTSAPSPYDFSQCCDTTSAGSPSPWHSQQQQQQQQQHHNHHQSMYSPSAFGVGGGMTNAFVLDGSYNNNNNPFCVDHHHHNHHQHHHQHGHDEDGHHVVDPLGLHVSAVGGSGSMFRERELELEMGGLIGNGLKGEWDGTGFDI